MLLPLARRLVHVLPSALATRLAIQLPGRSLRPAARPQEQDLLAQARPWEDLCAGWSFSGAGKELLLVYDEADKYVPHAQGDRLASLCRGATLVKVQGHGHTRMLSAPEVA